MAKTKKEKKQSSGNSEEVSAVSKRKSNNLTGGKINFLIVTISVCFIVAMIVGSGVSFYFYREYKRAVSDPIGQGKSEARMIVELLNKSIELPPEEPTLATITDRDKLLQQSFFKSAENGDKILIFSKSNKAILYRPSSQKVIEMIALGDVDQEKTDNSVAEDEVVPVAVKTDEETKISDLELVSVMIYNGTNIKGLAGNAELKMENESYVDVVGKKNAKGVYEKTIIVDLAGNKEEQAKRLSELFLAEIGDLPSGEIKPSADILIIVGGSMGN